MCLRRALQIALTFVLMMGGTVDAAEIRCGTYLIVVGDMSQEVLVRCGTPAAIDGDKWIYDQGPDEFTSVLHIRDGKVVAIEEGPYGTPGNVEISH